MFKLTDKEKVVFYGLIRYPELNDIELSERIDVKRPTVTAIRNRLENEKLYETKRIPDLTRLGCEIITATYTQYNPLTPYETRKKTKKENQNTFLEIQTDTQQLTLNATKNYTQAKKQLVEQLVYGIKNDYFSADDVRTITLPLSMSKIFLFFDYAPLLQRHFRLQAEDRVTCDTRLTDVEPYEFTENEKKIYCALIENPELKEGRIADMFSMSRHTVSGICNRIRENALLKTIRIPDFKKLGFELMVFNYVSLNSDKTLENRKHLLEKVLNDRSHVLMVSGNMETVTLMFFEDYQDFQTTMANLVEYARKDDYLSEEPKSLIFPREDIRYFRAASFTRLVKTLLDMG
jgi:DNA-binding MarR family transcriptional regulator